MLEDYGSLIDYLSYLIGLTDAPGFGTFSGILTFLSILIVSAIAVIFQRLCIAPLRGSPHVITLILITLGALFFLKGGALVVFGSDPHTLPAFSGNKPIAFLGAAI